MSYKTRLAECEKIISGAKTAMGHAAWEIARLLCEVYEDEEFRKDRPEPEEQLKFLSTFSYPFALTFEELRAAYREFPDAVVWETKGPRGVWDSYREARDSRKPKAERGTLSPTRAELMDEISDLKFQLAQRDARISELHDMLKLFTGKEAAA